MRARSSIDGVVVATVRARTPADAAGLVAGDRIVAINGHPLRDVIDFHYYSGEARLELTVEGEGGPRALGLVRRPGVDLGVELVAPRPHEIATCANKCVFCFIHQLPKGMRKSLYVKDDDFRLSFLHGNYITLTDLTDSDLARILEQRLSPLYVSVHATDPQVRHALLGAPRLEANVLPRLEMLANARIRVHAQIVLCPGLNDGAHLARTVRDLAPLHPSVATVAIVPVGLTAHRAKLPELRPLAADEARALVAIVSAWQRDWLAALGSRFVFLADEIYLAAGVEPPPESAYEGFPIVEDGVGLVRRFEADLARARRRLGRSARGRRAVTLVSGELYAPRLERALESLGLPRCEARVAAVPNRFFGGTISVVGLLTAQDIGRHLATFGELGDEVLVPSVAVRDGDGIFLDDATVDDLARDLGVPVRLVEPNARALLRLLRMPAAARAT